MDGMHRSSGTRYSIYTGDGNGRDSYIIVGNGGNLKPESFLNSAPHTGYHPPKKKRTKNVHRPCEKIQRLREGSNGFSLLG